MTYLAHTFFTKYVKKSFSVLLGCLTCLGSSLQSESSSERSPSINSREIEKEFKSLSLSDRSVIKDKFEEIIIKFIASRGFPGAVIAIYKNNEMILNEGYGNFVDVDRVYPIASLSKRFTYMAIEKLIQENLLSKDDKVFAYLNLPIALKDPRMNEMTIGELMDHKGGWSSEKGEDPLFSIDQLFPGESWQEIDKMAVIEKVLSSSILDHAPGTQEAYSSFGYLLLGEVIEKVSHMSYIEYINKTFAEPLGLKVHQAETPTVFSRETPFAGSFSLELSTSSFGLAARASDCARMLSYYQINGLPRDLSRTKSEQSWLSGSLPGTMTSLMRQRVNNVVIVIFIPDRDDNCWKDDNQDLRKEVDHAANCVGL